MGNCNGLFSGKNDNVKDPSKDGGDTNDKHSRVVKIDQKGLADVIARQKEEREAGYPAASSVRPDLKSRPVLSAS